MQSEENMSMDAEVVSLENNYSPNSSVDPAFPQHTQLQLAWHDIQNGVYKWRIWFMLAYQDIRLRYRRSVLGPFWITISMAITVYSMGFLYAHLFRTNLEEYYPFLVAGMLVWSLLSTMITELTDAYMASENLIKQVKLPYTLHIHRVVAKNILIFFHNIIVMLPIYFLFTETTQINLATLLIIPGLATIYLNGIIYGTLLAVIGARYRDISQIIKSLVQVIFFVTPVMWNPTILSEQNRYLVRLNPFYSFIELVRAPLLGNVPTIMNISMVLLTTIIGVVLCLKIFVPYRSRIIYWL